MQALIENNLLTEAKQPLSETTQEWVKLLAEFCHHPALENVPPLPDKAIARDSIYRERE